MATSLGKEINEMTREEKLKREARVLQETRTIQLRRQICELGFRHCRGRGKGKD